MTYNKKDIILSIVLMIFIISFAIVFTVFFKQLYYFDINYLNIDKISGLPVETIKDNYDILINYQSIFYQGNLNLPDFAMSVAGRIHFQEVKTIFERRCVFMTKQTTPTSSYKEVRIGKTIYRVTSFFSGEKDLGKTLEQLAVRRAMSEAIPAASGSK